MKRPKSVFANLNRILRLMWREDKRLLLAYFSTSVLGAFLLFVVYFAYKLMIDQVSGLAQGNAQPTFTLVVITFLFFEYLSRFVNYTFNNYYFEYLIRAKFQNLLTRMFLSKLAELDFAQLEDGQTRNLIAKVESSFNARLPDILTKINAVIYNIAALVFSLIIALQFSPTYFIVLALVSMPIYYLRAKYGNVAWSSYAMNAPKTNYLAYIKYLFTNFTTLNEIKMYGLSSHFVKKTKELQQDVLRDYTQPIKLYSLLSTVSFILIPVAIYFSLIRFVRRLTAGQQTVGDFTFFLNTLFTFAGQISSVLVNVGSIYENNLYAEDFFKLMSMKPAIFPRKIQTIPQTVSFEEIEFHNVGFTYPGGSRTSVEHVNFRIARGENIALVGRNGAGKSTLVKLLLRFYDPTEGVILVDGVDLRSIPIDIWYRQIGILFQDFARYYVTLRENISFGNLHKTTTRDGIHEAFVKAEGEELLSLLPQGYEQLLGRWFEGGVELSGGQWQKIAIARAIYRDAPLLILDEPTSAIDAETEMAIFNHLHKLYQLKTLLFISHRFSTVRNADRIFVMDGGHLVERGTHDELLYLDGLYAHYFEIQKRGYE